MTIFDNRLLIGNYCMVSTGYFHLIQFTTGLCRLTQDIAGYYRLLQFSKGYYSLLHVTSGYYSLVKATSGYYRLDNLQNIVPHSLWELLQRKPCLSCTDLALNESSLFFKFDLCVWDQTVRIKCRMTGPLSFFLQVHKYRHACLFASLLNL